MQRRSAKILQDEVESVLESPLAEGKRDIAWSAFAGVLMPIRRTGDGSGQRAGDSWIASSADTASVLPAQAGVQTASPPDSA